MTDSPALNEHSRQVLVAVQRARLPAGPIVVQGPGPIEPQKQSASSSVLVDTSKPPPPLPAESSDLLDVDASSEGDGEGEETGLRSGVSEAPTGPADPYASLDSAFGGYVADGPKPMSSRQEDDLLF